SDGKSVGIRVLRIQYEVTHGCNPRGAAYGRNNGPVRTDTRLLDQPSRKKRPQNPFVNEILVKGQLSLRMKRRHLCTSTGTAGRSIDHSGPGGWLVPIELACGHGHNIFSLRVRMCG